jgi:hypothetical protein
VGTCDVDEQLDRGRVAVVPEAEWQISLSILGCVSAAAKVYPPGPRPPYFSDIVRRVVISLVEELGLLVLQVGVLDEPDKLLNVKRVECSCRSESGDIVRDLRRDRP